MNVVEGCDVEEGGGQGAPLWLLKTLLVGAANPTHRNNLSLLPIGVSLVK